LPGSGLPGCDRSVAGSPESGPAESDRVGFGRAESERAGSDRPEPDRVQPDRPAAGSPESTRSGGVPAPGLPVTDSAVPGLSASGSPASGLLGPSLSVPGPPVPGPPVPGLPAPVSPASGLPEPGLAASGSAVSGSPGPGHPAPGSSGAPGSEAVTGPLRVPVHYSGLLNRGFDEVPTPRAGTSVQPPRAGTSVQPPPAGIGGQPSRVGPGVPSHVGTGVQPRSSSGVRPAPGPPGLGTPRTDRESVLALFAVHMFPLGHLPVAADRPERQLPAPVDAVAEGVRRPLFDHPESALLDDTAVLGYVKQGFRRAPAPPVDPEPPGVVVEGYSPPEGAEWERRFVVGAEYVWPPSGQFPEGSVAEPDPVVLPENTVLDRFGGDHGRVFAPDGTPFSERALPPAALRSGYRRYRVVKPLPVWQSTSAAWFDGPGGGIRFRTVLSADELVTLGFLADVTREV